MEKVCSRPECDRPATARFFFDARNKLVILDGRIAEWGGSGALCAQHADRLTPPRGWALDDRRIAAPRLFPVGRFDATEAGPAPTVAPRARRLGSPVAHESTPLPLDGGPGYALPDEYLATVARTI